MTVLKPCRKCGKLDCDMWNGLGTQADLCCNNCGQSEDIQVSDLYDYGEKPDFSMETISYTPEVVAFAKEALIKQWNKRLKDYKKLYKAMQKREEVLVKIMPNIKTGLEILSMSDGGAMKCEREGALKTLAQIKEWETLKSIRIKTMK